MELSPGPCDPAGEGPSKERSTYEHVNDIAAFRGFHAPQPCGLGFCELHARHLVELAANAVHKPAEIFSAREGPWSHGSGVVQDTRRWSNVGPSKAE
jgi:hypothetical protein